MGGNAPSHSGRNVRAGYRHGALISLALFCAGCTSPPTALPKSGPNPHLTITLQMAPQPVESLEPIRFIVRICNAAGQPVGGAAVQIHLDMPAMPMGDNTQTLRETQAGEYVGTGRFTMAGAWRVTVTAAQGQEQAVQAFPLEIR